MDFDADLPGGKEAPSERPNEADDLDPSAEELIEWEGKLYPIIRHPRMSEEQYVFHEVGITKAQITFGGLKDPDGKRCERSGQYARWRYRGYLVGEIASL
jgi:hypothetical protein